MDSITFKTGNGYESQLTSRDAKLLGNEVWTGFRFKNKQGKYYVYVGRRSRPGRNAPKMYLHRLVLEQMYPDYPDSYRRKMVGDHINGDTLDNRRENLRYASVSTNRMNAGPNAQGRSGWRGVHWNSNRQQWVGRIRLNKIDMFLGYFDTPEEAAASYAKAVKSLTASSAMPKMPRLLGEKK